MGIVHSSDVIDVHPSVAVLVQFLEGHGDHLLPGRVHGSPNGSNEFIDLHEATPIEVEVAKELLNLSLSESEHVVSHGLGELEFIERLGVIIIHDLELSLEPNESSRAS